MVDAALEEIVRVQSVKDVAFDEEVVEGAGGGEPGGPTGSCTSGVRGGKRTGPLPDACVNDRARGLGIRFFCDRSCSTNIRARW